MIVVLLLSGIGLLATPALSRSAGRRLCPSEWARVATIAFIGGAVLIDVALAGLAIPAVLALVGWSGLVRVCSEVMWHLAPTALTHVGWATAALAGFIAWRAFRSWRQLRSVRDVAHSPVPSQWLRAAPAYELVVLPSPELVAFSVAGICPRVVVSQGIASALSPEELGVVVRHEEAHLAHHHDRYLTATALVEGALGFLPLVRTSAKQVRLALERWADEAAADGEPAMREATRSALLRIAEAETAGPLAAFGAADTVLERVDALERPVVTSGLAARAAVWTTAAVLFASAVASFGGSVGDVHFALTHFCAV
jgi:Zn-dependent protease with chaperone function